MVIFVITFLKGGEGGGGGGMVFILSKLPASMKPCPGYELLFRFEQKHSILTHKSLSDKQF
jgi:hypothetical protein